MARAAVLIGANRTGKLPVLHDAAAGARRMQQWALESQGMAPHRVLLFTDDNGPIDVADIRRAIRQLVDSGSITQLIVYFAGHGVNIRYGEYWLLTDAPEDASAAVNVEGSVVLARRCGIPHVVFISDACRTAAEGVQAQGVTGTEIFPNDPVAGPESPVDIFFGTALGRPALEVKDPAASSAAFKAVYTAALLDAMSGSVPTVLASATLDGQPRRVVRPRPLKTLMQSELPKRLKALHLSSEVTQIPDARITSDDDAWLASLAPAPAPAPVAAPAPAAVPLPPAEALGAATAATVRGVRRGPRPVPVPGSAPRPLPRPPDLPRHLREPDRERQGGRIRPMTPEDLARSRLVAALSPGAADLRPPTRARAVVPPAPPPAQPDAGAYPPVHFETGCGFAVSGSTVAEAVSAGAQVGVKSDDAALVRVDTPDAAANVLLRLADGSGVLLPAIRDYVARVRVEGDEVVDVAYEPLEGRARSAAFTRDAVALRELRGLREVVAQAARDNAFRLEPGLADMLSQRMAYDGHLDPALALYAAYALHEMGSAARLAELAAALARELGLRLFDLDLLSRSTDPRAQAGLPTPLPPMPLLARGWTLLSAFGVRLPDELAGMERHLLPSLWTHVDRAGTDRLRELILTRRLP